MAIEANFTLNVVYLKYKDKNMINKELKRDKIKQEFEECIVYPIALKTGLSIEEFKDVLSQEADLRA